MNPVFLNVGIGKWYSVGSDRLAESLNTHGYTGDMLIWKDRWPEALHRLNHNTIYNVKAAAFQQALDAGYQTIIWADSSVYALKPVQPLIDAINAKGYWLGQSGHNAAQTCSDDCLRYFKVNRDDAEKMHDCATGLFGVNVQFPQARRFIQRFIQAALDGAFKGSRQHGGQSRDPRFKFHRQDQSCATIIAAQEGMALDEFSSMVAFKWDHYESVFKCEGM